MFAVRTELSILCKLYTEKTNFYVELEIFKKDTDKKTVVFFLGMENLKKGMY